MWEFSSDKESAPEFNPESTHFPELSQEPALIPALRTVPVLLSESSANRATNSESPAIMKPIPPDVMTFMPEPSQIVQCLVDSESLLPLIAFPVTVVAIMCVWATHCSPTPIEVKGFVPELPVWPDTGNLRIFCLPWCDPRSHSRVFCLPTYGHGGHSQVSCLS